MAGTSKAAPFADYKGWGDSAFHVKEMGNSRFLCENAVFQCTTPHHVILNNVKDLSKTHRFGQAGTVTINDRSFAFGSG